MFLYFLFSTCLIQIFEQDKPIKYYNNLLQKTVVLIETEIFYRINQHEEFMELPSNHDVTLELKIFNATTGDWATFKQKSNLVGEYVRYIPKVKFFFTATENDYYLYELSLTSYDSDYQYALQTNFYEGRQGDPSIMSQADNQIRELRKNIEDAMEYMSQISSVQKLDSLRDEEYYSLIKSIRSIVFIIVALKIAVFLCMFNWFNKQLRDFYVSKKIIKK